LNPRTLKLLALGYSVKVIVLGLACLMILISQLEP
jgi:hypothetical protein